MPAHLPIGTGLVFGILDKTKRSFTAARSRVRFHELRHIAATARGFAHCVIGVGRALAILRQTTYRYVSANVETAKRAAAAVDAFNAETRETVTAPELVH